MISILAQQYDPRTIDYLQWQFHEDIAVTFSRNRPIANTETKKQKTKNNT